MPIPPGIGGSDEPPFRIISKKELLRIVPYCDQHILRLEKQGKFPRRLRVGENRVGWRSDQIAVWMNGLKPRDHDTQDDD